MKTKALLAITTAVILSILSPVQAQERSDWKQYKDVIRKGVYKDSKLMFREAGGALYHPFIVPGGEQYGNVLWDWDSWLSNIALRQILHDTASKQERDDAEKYQRGCILNYLAYSGIDGWIPTTITQDPAHQLPKPKDVWSENMHKPCLAQHAAFLVQQNGGDASWLKDVFFRLEYFIGGYVNRYRHLPTGLYFWQNDVMIGVDNDPSTYYRPDRSSGSIYLNCMMYKELRAMEYLCGQLDLGEIAIQYRDDANKLQAAIQEHCWDEWTGFFYSVDLNLKPLTQEKSDYHYGAPRAWDCLIQRIGVWSGFLAMWADIATPEQAKRMIKEHYLNEKTFNAPYGVRTLSKMEKMYSLKASGNPSTWLGPIWGISNYMTWRGLVKYGFTKEARELAAKTIVMFGRDLQENGSMHEYYQPENGEPILNPGFQDWNNLVVNMLNWMEGKEVIAEF